MHQGDLDPKLEYGFVVANAAFKERYDFISRHLAEISRVDFQYVGVVGSSEIEREPGCGDVDKLSAGQIGCALSHLNAYRIMVCEGITRAVIVEDDARLPKDFDEILLQITSELREGEVISLHSPNVLKQEFSSVDAVRIKNFDLLTPFRAGTVRSTLCYVIDIEAARRILEHNYPVRVVADNFMWFWQSGCVKHIRVASPSPVLVEPFRSTIGYLRKGSATYLLSQLLNSLPVSKQILKMRRRRLRLQRESYQVRVAEASGLAGGNPNYK